MDVVENEYWVVGSIILDERAIPIARETLTPEDFSMQWEGRVMGYDVEQRVWQRILLRNLRKIWRRKHGRESAIPDALREQEGDA